jgi:hypothetical protein
MHILQLSFLYLLHMNSDIWEKCCTKMLISGTCKRDTHIKCKQDNLYRMTWYTGTCSNNGHGLIIHVNFMVKCVCYMGALDPMVSWSRCNHSLWLGHYRTDVISGVGHPRLDSIVPLVLRTVYCAMVGVLALYYRSLETAPTLLRRGNISSKPCCWTMTIVYIIWIYYIYIYISLII